MQVQVSSGNEAPIYQQIVNQVRYLVASGQMDPGEELLPMRTLAEHLVVNPKTVARAYLELERAGVVVKRRGSGTYVAERPPLLNQRQKKQILFERIDALLAEAHQLGVELDELQAMLGQRSERLHR